MQPNHYDKATTNATKKPNTVIETTKNNTNRMTALIAPTGTNKTVSVKHTLGAANGKTVRLYGAKLSAPILEPNLDRMTTVIKSYKSHLYAPVIANFQKAFDLKRKEITASTEGKIK